MCVAQTVLITKDQSATEKLCRGQERDIERGGTHSTLSSTVQYAIFFPHPPATADKPPCGRAADVRVVHLAFHLTHFCDPREPSGHRE